jgi:chromosomal replication initiator protein
VLDDVITISFSALSSQQACARPRGAEREFIAGPENRVAVAAIASLIQHWGTRYNPLVLYGPPGTGKSLIARGIGALLRSRSADANVVHFTATDFARGLSAAMETDTTNEFAEQIHDADLLVLEDLHLLAGGNHVQQELTHLFDSLTSESRQIVVTMRAAPASEMALSSPLRGRLLAGLAIPLAPPADAARRQMVRQCAARAGLAADDELVSCLASRVGSTFRELRAAVEALAGGRANLPLDSPQTRRDRPAELSKIAQLTAKHFGLRATELRATSRRRNAATARAVAMYLGRELTGLSFAKIGKYFGGRDHSTVMHAWHKINTQMRVDDHIRAHVELVRESIVDTLARYQSDAPMAIRG